MRDRQIKREQQKGATLIVALIILIVLMLLGITAVFTSNTQFKLAGNLQFENAAKNSAENAIAEREEWVGQAANATNACFSSYGMTCGKLYPKGYLSAGTDPRSILSGNGDQMIELIAKSVAAPGTGLGEVCGAPGIAFELNLYRITAVGIDARGANRYVQSIFQTRIPC